MSSFKLWVISFLQIAYLPSTVRAGLSNCKKVARLFFAEAESSMSLLTANRRSARFALARQMIGEAFTIRGLPIRESFPDLSAIPETD